MRKLTLLAGKWQINATREIIPLSTIKTTTVHSLNTIFVITIIRWLLRAGDPIEKRNGPPSASIHKPIMFQNVFLSM